MLNFRVSTLSLTQDESIKTVNNRNSTIFFREKKLWDLEVRRSNLKCVNMVIIRKRTLFIIIFFIIYG